MNEDYKKGSFRILKELEDGFATLDDYDLGHIMDINKEDCTLLVAYLIKLHKIKYKDITLKKLEL